MQFALPLNKTDQFRVELINSNRISQLDIICSKFAVSVSSSANFKLDSQFEDVIISTIKE